MNVVIASLSNTLFQVATYIALAFAFFGTLYLVCWGLSHAWHSGKLVAVHNHYKKRCVEEVEGDESEKEND